jgi:hypothetical protein
MRTSGLAGGPFSYTWGFAICPYRVQISLSVVEALQTEMAARPEPLQGLLFGQTGAGLVDIQEWRGLPTLDRTTFGTLPEGESRNVLGYYIIREGNSFILSPAEVALAQEFFRKPGSVVLLVERRRRGPAEATFFFWRGEVFVHNLPLPFPFHAGVLAGETPGLREVPASTTPPHRSPPVPSHFRRRALLVGLYAASALAAGGIVAAHLRNQPRSVRPSPELAEITPPAEARWIRTEPKRDLELSWDARAESVSAATAGVLKIEDSGATRQMALDVGELLMGSILYAPASDRIRVELTTLQRDGRMMPVAVAAQPAIPAYSAPVAESLPPVPEKKLETLPLKKAEAVTQVAAAVPRPPLKRFVWTSAERAEAIPGPMPEVPHQSLPAVNPAALTAELSSNALGIPTPTAPPPPKPAPAAAPAPSTAPARTMPHAGRLIWTGTLLRRGVVEFDGRSVSIGSLSGGLPGVPVNVSVTPAEFGEDGLMAYTTDASRHNRVEQPSAGNGWNKVTYVWAPERVREIAVLESPNPANNFARLAVRSDARKCSMLLIDWNLR